MSASFVELEVMGSLPALRCPVTGIPAYDEDGFDEDGPHSVFLRFFVDWLGEMHVAESEDPLQVAIAHTWGSAGENDSDNDLIATVVDLLPKTAVVFEVLDPPYGRMKAPSATLVTNSATGSDKRREARCQQSNAGMVTTSSRHTPRLAG